MTIKVTYVDDEIGVANRDAEKIRDLLEDPGKFECILEQPPKSFSYLRPKLQDALLVDLDLSGVPANGGQAVDYLGNSLASDVRMHNPGCPIILITRPHILGEEWQKQFLQESNDLDLIIYKNDVLRNPSEERAKIEDLVQGFKALHEVYGQEWEAVVKLMGADDEESNLLREAGPPVAQGRWNLPQASRWIRTVIMRFPGILYDDLTAATRLGISLDSFRLPSLQDYLKPARYTGVFGNYQTYWWRGRLFGLAQRFLLENDVKGPFSQHFGDTYSRVSKEKINPAICIFDGTPIADWVCHIYKEPVKQKNSIPYYPDSRPQGMDQARVSFKAVQESEEFDLSLVDAESHELVKSMWK